MFLENPPSTSSTTTQSSTTTPFSPSPSPPSNPPLSVAIIGAGIGGLALAIGLQRQHIPYTIYESAPQYSTVGAGVGLGPNALRAMDMLEPRFRAMYNDIATGNATPGTEHVMMYAYNAFESDFGASSGWGEPVEYSGYTRASAHRKALLEIMTSFIPADTVRFGMKAVRLRQVGEQVEVEFESGEVVVADTVIGCDGGNRGKSRVAVLEEEYPEHVEATYSGKYVYRSIVPMEDAVGLIGEKARESLTFVGKGTNILAFPISKGSHTNVVAFCYKPWDQEQWTKEVTREEMVADFEGRMDEKSIRLLDWAKPLQWSLWHHLDTPTYYKGRICLLGDSAHAGLPHQAANAGQALEDAVILSHLLGRVRSPAQLTDAFRIYDSIRRPRAQKVVRTSMDAGYVYTMEDPECGADRQKTMDNFNSRFLWIWDHDLLADVRKADEEFGKLVLREKGA